MTFSPYKIWRESHLSHSITLEVQIAWEISAFQCCRWKYRNAEKLLNFQKFQLKWKILKHFTRSKKQAALSKLLSLHPPLIPQAKILLRLWKNIFLRRYTEIYRHLLSKWLKNAALGCQEMVKCKFFFPDTHRNSFAGKFVKWERFLIMFREHFIINIKWLEVQKISEVFWVKPYCKMTDLFAKFCWLWDFLLENLKL